MEVIYNLSGVLVFAVIVCGIVGAIRPAIFRKVLKQFATRKFIIIGAVVLFFTFGSILSVTEPARVKQERLDREQAAQQQELDEAAARKKAEEANKETTKEVTVTEPVPFDSETKSDNALAKDTQKVVQDGVDGEKAVVYVVTYKSDQEVKREKKSETVTKPAVPKITAIGTYMAPAPTINCPNGTYLNSAGNTVCRPAESTNGTPAGATARCRDGTYSYSQSRRGTCSHHGGVATWL